MTDQEVDKTKERSFAEHALSRLAIAEKILGFEFTGIRRLFQEKGAVAAAIQLLDRSHSFQPQTGFSSLAESRLLDYSLEQSVLDFACSGLFPVGIIRSARTRLTVTKQRLEREKEKAAAVSRMASSSSVRDLKDRS